MTAPPPSGVLRAFGVSAEARQLAGGQGRSWRAGDVVLKPVDEVAEYSWVCEVSASWDCAEVAVPAPLQAADGWVAHGWGAQGWSPGTTAVVADDPDWFRSVHAAFHAAVADLPRPGFLDTREDAWAYGDRVAWEGAEPAGGAATRALLERALGLLEPVDLSTQVVHGDMGGNVLRDGDRATVIDWPPYWRPVAWSLAVVATDAVCWEGADESLLDLWSTDAQWPQVLLRAAIYRLATRGRNEVRGAVPAGSDGYVTEEGRLLALIEARL